MRLEPPAFWGRKDALLGKLLGPAGSLYGAMAERRFARATPYRSKLPVVCIGNLTVGGGGKTPTAIWLAGALQACGERPAFLSRGYGGKLAGPVQVADAHTATDIGDEALLLANTAPAFIAHDRAAGAQTIEGTDASLILMDDGFQNPDLAKNFCLIVADADVGVGNGRTLPAGPLRAPLDAQIGRADALLVIGTENGASELASRFERKDKPIFSGRLQPAEDTRWLSVLPAIGFAGIARPEKFFNTLRSAGGRVEETVPFPDHHPFSEDDAAKLLARAAESRRMLVTTEKDWVRLPDKDGKRAELKFRSRPLRVRLEVEEVERLVGLVRTRLGQTS